MRRPFVLLIAALLTGCQSTTPAPAAATPSTAYGTSMATAVEVCKPPGERAYLARLRCADGNPPTFSRRGSGPSRSTPKSPADEQKMLDQMYAEIAPGDPDFHIVDYYEVTCGSKTTTVVMDMYHCKAAPPAQAPPGFTIVPAQ
jgi:hypothetical protein